jgi:hypothetical protein
MQREAKLPDRCVKCNRPAGGRVDTCHLSAAGGPLSKSEAAFGAKAWLILGVVDVMTAKTANVNVGLCSTCHREQRLRT